jgi:hypothetical protein
MTTKSIAKSNRKDSGIRNIYIYREGDLSNPWSGVRVAVSVGGKLKQGWYSYEEYTETTAMNLALADKEKWLKMQKTAAQNNTRSRSNTGHRNLSFVYEEKVSDSGVIYNYPLITFQLHKTDAKGSLTSKANKSFHKWRISEDLVITDEQWFEICLQVKNTRGMRQKTFEMLLEKKPDSKKYFTKNNKPRIGKLQLVAKAA